MEEDGPDHSYKVLIVVIVLLALDYFFNDGRVIDYVGSAFARLINTVYDATIGAFFRWIFGFW